MPNTTTAPVPMERFGKDHWSLLAYVETLVVDQQPIDRRRMRCNETTHPLLKGAHTPSGWKPDYGTRLKGYFNAAPEQKASLQLPEHDDWDCLEDLEAAGLLEVATLTSGVVRLTPEGRRLANLLREHKEQGGVFATFDPSGTPHVA